MTDSNDITLGEVGRNVEATRKDVGDLRKDVTELKVRDALSGLPSRRSSRPLSLPGAGIKPLVSAPQSQQSQGWH